MNDRDIQKFVRGVRTPKGKKPTEHTKRQHERVVKDFKKWCEGEGIDDWWDVQPSDIGAYLSYKEDQGSGPADLNNHFGSLKKFYDFIGQDYPGKVNPVRQHGTVTSYPQGKTLRKEKGFETGMSDDEYQQLLSGVWKRHAERDKLIIRLMGECGLRRSEVRELRVEDVTLDTQRIDVPGTKSEPRTIKFRRQLKPALRRWIEGGQREAYQKAFDSPHLFPSQRAEQLTGKGINDIVIKAAERAGIQETMFTTKNDHEKNRITAHQLRHYFGKREMRDPEGLDLKPLSEYMGHSSVDITADMYGDMSQEEAFEMIDSLIQ